MAEVERIDLPPEPASAGVARRAVRQACGGAASDVHALLLCTSELVTNAVLHGVPPITLEIEVTDPSIRIAVHDRGTATIERRQALTGDTLSGRGLGIVETLAASWGYDRTARGNVAWFEMPRQPRETPT